MALPAGMLETEFPKFIYAYGGDHMIQEYVDTFAANELNAFIVLAQKIRRKKHFLPFMFFNSDRRDKNGTHWLMLMNICPKNTLFFFR